MPPTLARPLMVVATIGLERDAVERVVTEITRLAAEEDGLSLVVVGLPRRLDGSVSDMTPKVAAFGARLRERLAVPVVFQDERLSSREAESRLAVREKDWRTEAEARRRGRRRHPAGSPGRHSEGPANVARSR